MIIVYHGYHLGRFFFYHLWLLSNWKYCHINKDLVLSNSLFLRNLVSVTVARDP